MAGRDHQAAWPLQTFLLLGNNGAFQVQYYFDLSWISIIFQ